MSRTTPLSLTLATSTVATGAIGHDGARTQIDVYNTEQLYDAVNDANNNTGVEVVLEQAVYMLSALDPCPSHDPTEVASSSSRT